MTLNFKLARMCARAAADAYDEATIAHDETCTQVLLRETETHLIVAFRGTSSVRDFLTDAKCRMVQGECGRVHRGFLSCLAAVSDLVFSQLRGNTKPILITGHSLGGALAMLFAEWLDRTVRTGIPFEAVYTFGQPRVGNGAFANHYDHILGDRTFRFVFEEDLVARVPGVLMGYRHTGQEVFIPSLCRAFCPQGYLLNPSLIVKLISDACGLFRLGGTSRLMALAVIGDHAAEGYVRAIDSLYVVR